MNENRLELFQFAVDCGMLDAQAIKQKIEMTKRQDIEIKHQYRIYQLSDGRWGTNVYDKTRKNHQRSIIKRTRNDLLDYLREYYNEMETNPTINDCYEIWMNGLINRRDSTISRYKKQYKQFFAGTEFANTRIKNMSRRNVEQFVIGIMLEKRLTKNAYNKLWEILNAILDIALDDFDIDLGKIATRDKLKRKFKNAFSKTRDDISPDTDKYFDLVDEIPRVIEYCKTSGTLVDLGIILTFFTGLRVSECSALRKSDISPDFKYLKIHAIEQHFNRDGHIITTVYEQGSKTNAGTRRVPIPDKAVPIVKRILMLSDPKNVFLFSDTKLGRYKSAKFQRRIAVICKNLNIVNKSFTDIRHTYASIIDESGLSNKEKASVMGHTSYDVTQKHYIKDIRDVDYKREKINQVI